MAPAVFHGGMNEVLLTALAIAIKEWQRQRARSTSSVLIDLESHGRHELVRGMDLTRTVGWFTCIYPVRLDLDVIDLDEVWAGGVALGRAFRRISEQLRTAPDGGIGYGLLRYLNPETASGLAALETPAIGFNYLGRLVEVVDTVWGPAHDEGSIGSDADPEMPLLHSLGLSAVAIDSGDGAQLQASWSWAPSLFAEKDIRELAENWFEALEILVQCASDLRRVARTASDVELLALTQEDLELLESRHEAWVRARGELGSEPAEGSID